LFIFCGTIGALVQGGAIGRLVQKYGEPRLISVSLLLTAVSLALLPFIRGDGELSWTRVFQGHDWPWVKMLIVLALLSVGSSLTRPPVFGLLSNLTPAAEQGATIGVAQGAGSLARVLGPLFAATLYDHVQALPYVLCAAVSALAGVLAFQRLRTLGTPEKTSSLPPA
ncbi:MAG TPA: MFS transporter, partial [Verrucomicrobiota bacterium]|nr:MFS transporter [Verrucomicrobiota bacterium]